jgi:hypothetical protein
VVEVRLHLGGAPYFVLMKRAAESRATKEWNRLWHLAVPLYGVRINEQLPVFSKTQGHSVCEATYHI